MSFLLRAAQLAVLEPGLLLPTSSVQSTFWNDAKLG